MYWKPREEILETNKQLAILILLLWMIQQLAVEILLLLFSTPAVSTAADTSSADDIGKIEDSWFLDTLLCFGAANKLNLRLGMISYPGLQCTVPDVSKKWTSVFVNCDSEFIVVDPPSGWST